MDSDDRGRVTRARFCFGGVAPVPMRVTQAESAVAGAVWDEAAVDRVQQALDGTLTPLSDHRGSREYRLEVSKALVHKFWWEHRIVPDRAPSIATQTTRCSGRAVPHEAAAGHVTGAALYTDDLSGRFPHLLHAWPVTAPHAHARVVSVSTSRVR